MKQFKRLKKCFGKALTILLVAALVGCGSPDARESGDVSSQAQGSEATGESQSSSPDLNGQESKEVSSGEGSQEEGRILVHSIEELVEAIAPGARITLEPGRYNMTDFMNRFPTVEAQDEWNEKHEYVRIDSEFDGLELVVKNVQGLQISGGAQNPAGTEIVTEPRYAALFTFENCKDIEMDNLTLGHTENGDCDGNVIDLDACQGIILKKLDIYGCGVYGIEAMNGTKDMQVSDSVIRDCEYGPFVIDDGVGEFTFTDCTFQGSGGSGYYDDNDASKLSFIRCSFGQRESNYWYFVESAEFEDCQWSEITEYPDYEYGGEDEAVYVSSVEELLEAINPMATIILTSGEYDLSEFLDRFQSEAECQAWNAEHDRVQIRDVYDGKEIVIKSTIGLFIEGESGDPADVHIVTKPRHASVLCFEDCSNINISYLTMGHVEGGECSGNVLDFSNCDFVNLYKLDLYGCGAYGVFASNMESGGNFQIDECLIRDCTYGPFEIYGNVGSYRFADCTFTGSAGGGEYDNLGHNALYFTRCKFGINESNTWLFRRDAEISDCEFEHATEYPDIPE